MRSRHVLIWCIGIFAERKDRQNIENGIQLYDVGTDSEYFVYDRGVLSVVNLFEKKGKEVFAGGRIIVTDFRKLKKDDLPAYEEGDGVVVNYDGKVYINSRAVSSEIIIPIFKILVEYPMDKLKELQEEQRKEFPDVKEVDDLKKLIGNQKKFMLALAMLLVPAEIRSRELQRAYYGIL